MALTRPTTISTAWASGASGSYINTVPASGTGALGIANWNLGFPPLTMTAIGSGGYPPWGQDMNGVLNALSANLQWINAGGSPAYDATLSTAIGGYPLGAVLQLSSGLGAYVNLVAGNTNDPNSVLTNWAPWAGSLMADKVSLASSASAAVGAGLVGYSSAQAYGAGTVGNALNNAPLRYATTTGTNTYALTLGTGGPVNGMIVWFQVTTGGGNTGAATLNLNSTGAVALVNNKNGALVVNDLLSAGIYSFIYDSTLVKWLMLGPAISQLKNIDASLPNTGALTTASSIAIMTGFKKYFTAQTTGRIKVTIQGICNHSASPFYVSCAAYIGTGVAPNAGAASTGGPLTFGGLGFNTISSVTYTAGAPFTLTSYQYNLVLGTQYWIDMAGWANTTGTVNFGVLTCIIEEI